MTICVAKWVGLISSIIAILLSSYNRIQSYIVLHNLRNSHFDYRIGLCYQSF